MPRPAPHALIWCEDSQEYELQRGGKPERRFTRGDEQAFACWLAEHAAFSFVGRAGRLSVLKEARSRGAGYWYAYRTQDRHTHKRYLGPTAKVTFARLEAAAKELTGKLSSASFLWPDRRPFLHRRGLNPGAHPPRVQPHTS